MDSNIILGDLLVDRALNYSCVKNTLAALFNISKLDIQVVDNIEDVILDGDIQLVCTAHSTKGEFVQMLSFYAHQLRLEKFNTVSTLQQFCRDLGCRCLLPDNSLNPFAYWLIDGIHERQKVHIDTEKECRDEYVIVY